MKPIEQSAIQKAVSDGLSAASDLLCEMIRFPSTSGQEHELMLYLEDFFQKSGLEVERAAMNDRLKGDPAYSSPVDGICYEGRFNLRLRRSGTGGGRTLLFNAHSDVVPASPGMEDAFHPRVENGGVYGRGACDDKGQIALLALTLSALDTLDVKLPGEIIAHIVNEEENGGNGSLAMMRSGENADACIVLEPTEGRLLTSIRGAVWFRLQFSGVAGHSGSTGKTSSALLKARDAIGILEKYHDDLLAASRGITFFDNYPNPMPITFGRLQSGNWPAAAPNSALLEGVLGLLPNRTASEVCLEMNEALKAGGLKEGDDYRLTFMYRHDCSVLDPKHELPQRLAAAVENSGGEARMDAMTASCDACYYRNDLGIPTLVFGAGSLGVAHSVNEHIQLDDISAAAEALVRFIVDYNRETE